MAVHIVLGLFDILTGVLLLTGGMAFLTGNGLVITLAIFMLFKGGWFFLTEFTKSKERNYWNTYMGFINLVSGILLYMVYVGFFHPVFSLAGILVLLNGTWYFIRGLSH